MPLPHLPAGYNTVTPYLCIRGAAEAIEFYKKVFGAEEVLRIPGPAGRVGHAEIQIADSRIMLSDEFPDWGNVGPETLGGTPVGLALYVPNVDQVVDRAVAAGAKLIMPIKDQFYGDRSGTVLDPFGHKWTIATHIEDVSPEELQKRAAAMFSQNG